MNDNKKLCELTYGELFTYNGNLYTCASPSGVEINVYNVDKFRFEKLPKYTNVHKV